MKIKCVSGPPASGKSTYVKEHHGNNDIIFDHDAMCVAITGNETHTNRTEGQLHVCNRLRYDLLRAAENAETIDTFWMIATVVTDTIRDALGDECEYIEMKVDKDEAKKRVDNDDTRPNKQKEYEKIDRYFEEKSMPIRDNREYRSMVSFDVTPSEEDKYILEGYASTYDPYVLFEDEDGTKYFEQILPEAFNDCDTSDVVLLCDHQGKVFARTKNYTLVITIDSHGLFVRADMSKTEASRAAYEEIKAGMYSQMSFSFIVSDDEYDSKEHKRIIRSLKKIYDVSFVAFPANNFTSLATRSRFDGFIKAEQTERSEREKALELARKKFEFLEVIST